ncbi:hypothetical protein CEXT_500891 [Caerostris extrusa]|uniref:Uncharacterized protein n=1 Tax=Caerostris extrusa TaxID=172846 RepID=A0AAV4X7Y7_CAEEX|nr:hypothetical protein CEXT_500891 [Caerostris extrusa]
MIIIIIKIWTKNHLGINQFQRIARKIMGKGGGGTKKEEENRLAEGWKGQHHSEIELCHYHNCTQGNLELRWYQNCTIACYRTAAVLGLFL